MNRVFSFIFFGLLLFSLIILFLGFLSYQIVPEANNRSSFLAVMVIFIVLGPSFYFSYRLFDKRADYWGEKNIWAYGWGPKTWLFMILAFLCFGLGVVLTAAGYPPWGLLAIALFGMLFFLFFIKALKGDI